MQRHFLRAELWCFIFGEGSFLTKRGKIGGRQLTESGSFAHVQLNEWHKYAAKTRTLVLEIQTGHCEEEDIERQN